MQYKLINPINPSYSLIEQLFYNRGITNIYNYINTTDDDIYSYKLLKNIKEGAELLLKHIKNKSKIFIQVDSDVDGYTSSALLLNYLYAVFPEIIPNITYRLHTNKEHGIVLDVILDKDYNLVIIPDAGSNQYEEHAILKAKGIDILILDHHETEKESENAIIINNQLSPLYPNKYISGAGIVYKFCQQLDEILNINRADKFLDLVALGMAADMMSLKEKETKHLINKGIKQINNYFLQKLIEKQAYSIGDIANITIMDVLFYIAPLINAIIRVGTTEEKELLFKAFLDMYNLQQVKSTKRGTKKDETETIVDQVCRIATNCKAKQKRIRDNNFQKAIEIIEEQGLDKNKIIILNGTDIVDKNLTGLIAMQLVTKYKKPVLLLREDGETEILQGSARGYDKSALKDFKAFLSELNIFEYTEGHANAFGAAIHKNNIEKFIQIVNEKLKDFDFEPYYLVDFIWDSSEIKYDDVLAIGNMKKYWGTDMNEPLIAIENVKITSTNTILMSPTGNPTLKITLPNGINIIKFGSSTEEYNNLVKSMGVTTINLVGKCSLNEWQGNITPQILIEDYMIVNNTEYYF